MSEGGFKVSKDIAKRIRDFVKADLQSLNRGDGVVDESPKDNTGNIFTRDGTNAPHGILNIDGVLHWFP